MSTQNAVTFSNTHSARWATTDPVVNSFVDDRTGDTPDNAAGLVVVVVASERDRFPARPVPSRIDRMRACSD